MANCAKCGGELSAELKIFRQTLCPHCTAYLHACNQCELHDPGAHNQCRESQAEFVANREKANFCDFFQLVGGKRRGRGAGGTAPQVGREQRALDAKARLEALFKKSTDEDETA